MFSPNDVNRLAGYVPGLINAIGVTVLVAWVSIALATAIGILVAGALVGPSRGIRLVAGAYVEFVRAIPELVQVYIWFFFLPATGIVLPPMFAGVVALAVAFGPYLAEVFRAGIIAIEPTQWEAAQVLGMGRITLWRRIVLPQAFRTVLPVWTGYFITMFKATSLLSFITVPELFGFARFTAADNFRYFELFGIVMAVYLALGVPTVAVLHRLERRLDISVTAPARAVREAQLHSMV